MIATDHSPTLGLAVLVAVSGGAGAVLRMFIMHYFSVRRSDPLPLGTLLVNASGSLVLGVLTGLSMYRGLGPHTLTIFGLGLCGGYTTWSTASWESVHLARSGHRVEAVSYTLGGLALCLGAAASGIGLAGVA